MGLLQRRPKKFILNNFSQLRETCSTWKFNCKFAWLFGQFSLKIFQILQKFKRKSWWSLFEMFKDYLTHWKVLNPPSLYETIFLTSIGILGHGSFGDSLLKTNQKNSNHFYLCL
jgi:hypothetical protein